MATECEYLVPALRQNITILSQNWDGIIKVVQPINYIMSLILSLNCDVIFFWQNAFIGPLSFTFVTDWSFKFFM
jgi:hypothetical protein